MKRWNTVMGFAREITTRDILPENSTKKEIGISQASKAASIFVKEYKNNNKDVKRTITSAVQLCQKAVDKNGSPIFTTNQLERLYHIFRIMFKYHWMPWSRISRNMKRTISA